MDDDAFVDLPSLERLELNANGLVRVPAVALAAVGGGLRRLGLAGNRLAAVQEGDFDGLMAVETLDLSENVDLALNSASLLGLRDSLLRLYLSSCGFTSWRQLAPALAPLDRLESLFLGGNYFKVYDERLFPPV
jgi:hypothetical protein